MRWTIQILFLSEKCQTYLSETILFCTIRANSSSRLLAFSNSVSNIEIGWSILKFLFREAKESLELEEAQVRYEFEGLKSSLLSQLEEQDRAHSEKIYHMEQVEIQNHIILKKWFIKV